MTELLEVASRIAGAANWDRGINQKADYSIRLAHELIRQCREIEAKELKEKQDRCPHNEHVYGANYICKLCGKYVEELKEKQKPSRAVPSTSGIDFLVELHKLNPNNPNP
jgi:hypothetical protein